MADSLRGNGTSLHGTSKREGGENGDLVCGIKAINISGGIGFGVTEFLGIPEHGVVGRALIGHSREDVVGGAVDDSADPVDAVPPKGLLERFDDRDATSDRGFDQHVDTGLCRSLGDFLTVPSDHSLVGCHHRFAGGDGLEDECSRWLDATDDFNDHINAWVIDHIRWVGGQDRSRYINRPWPLEIANGDPNQLQVGHQRMTFAR